MAAAPSLPCFELPAAPLAAEGSEEQARVDEEAAADEVEK